MRKIGLRFELFTQTGRTHVGDYANDGERLGCVLQRVVAELLQPSTERVERGKECLRRRLVDQHDGEGARAIVLRQTSPSEDPDAERFQVLRSDNLHADGSLPLFGVNGALELETASEGRLPHRQTKHGRRRLDSAVIFEPLQQPIVKLNDPRRTVRGGGHGEAEREDTLGPDS